MGVLRWWEMRLVGLRGEMTLRKYAPGQGALIGLRDTPKGKEAAQSS